MRVAAGKPPLQYRVLSAEYLINALIILHKLRNEVPVCSRLASNAGCPGQHVRLAIFNPGFPALILRSLPCYRGGGISAEESGCLPDQNYSHGINPKEHHHRNYLLGSRKHLARSTRYPPTQQHAGTYRTFLFFLSGPSAHCVCLIAAAIFTPKWPFLWPGRGQLLYSWR